MAENLFWHNAKTTQTDRARRNGHRAACLWFTGLSGSGKSTIAVELERTLFERGMHAYILDGDNIRTRLNRDLGFTDEDRTENIRRIGEVARLFVDSGTIVITAFISPFRADRAAVRALFAPGQFIEIYVECDLETCRRRDPKGLYEKAANGAISNFTGITSAYEPPERPELTLDNGDGVSVEANVERVLGYLSHKGIIGNTP